MGPNGGYVPFTRLMVQSYGQCLGKVSTFFFSSTIFEFLVLGRNFMWTWFNIWWRKSINKKCISSCGNFHENFCSNEQRLHALRPSYTIEISVLGMFFTRVSHPEASCYGVSKCKLLICQSSHGLCKTKQDNTMMTRFFRNEMTLKTTLLVWEPMVTYNGLVSWVTSLEERLWPLMNLTSIGVFFSTIANLYCHTIFLSMKHVDAP